MKIETKGKAMELLNKALPYSNQISNIDLDKDDAIYFRWRHTDFKLDMNYGRIDEVDGCLLIGSNVAMCMTELLRRVYMSEPTITTFSNDHHLSEGVKFEE